MLLAFNPADLITIPFGYLLDYLYQFTSNYGISLILFAIIVQLVLFPITAKSKKSMMKMSRLQPKMQEIREKYANDQQKQNEAIQQLQKEEGASMGCTGCLWSLLPLLILLPLYQVVRQPMVYILHESAESAQQIIDAMKEIAPALYPQNNYYDQVVTASHISEYATELLKVLPDINARTLEGLNFSFMNFGNYGIDLGSIPQWKFWSAEWQWTWSFIGAALIPLLSAGSQVLQMWISQKMNDSVVTDEKGLQDQETAKQSQSAQTSKMMMWTMPLMSLFIGFTVPCALSLYWLIGGVVRMVQDFILTKHYRKVYDAEDAERLQRHMEQEALEAEKERLRAEKRAANPDGITENTSKKKLQKKQRAEEEAERAANAREYAAKKGVVEEDETAAKLPMSGINERPYCKGRAYDSNRYSSNSTEE